MCVYARGCVPLHISLAEPESCAVSRLDQGPRSSQPVARNFFWLLKFGKVSDNLL